MKLKYKLCVAMFPCLDYRLFILLLRLVAIETHAAVKTLHRRPSCRVRSVAQPCSSIDCLTFLASLLRNQMFNVTFSHIKLNLFDVLTFIKSCRSLTSLKTYRYAFGIKKITFFFVIVAMSKISIVI